MLFCPQLNVWICPKPTFCHKFPTLFLLLHPWSFYFSPAFSSEDRWKAVDPFEEGVLLPKKPLEIHKSVLLDQNGEKKNMEIYPFTLIIFLTSYVLFWLKRLVAFHLTFFSDITPFRNHKMLFFFYHWINLIIVRVSIRIRPGYVVMKKISCSAQLSMKYFLLINVNIYEQER